MSTFAIRSILADIARAEIGVREIPKNSNSGPRVLEYQRATWLDGTGWAWCAAFQCWCIREWLKRSEVRDAFKFTVAQAEEWRPKTAAAYRFHQWAESKGLLQMDDSPNHVLHCADLVTFDISHIGMVVDDHHNVIETVEGNTDATGGREGGGVYAMTRERSFAKRFIRLLS